MGELVLEDTENKLGWHCRLVVVLIDLLTRDSHKDAGKSCLARNYWDVIL